MDCWYISVVPVVQSLVFCVLFCRSVCHVVLFLFDIALSALRVTSSEYPVGISNLFKVSNLRSTTLGVSQKIPPPPKKKQTKKKTKTKTKTKIKKKDRCKGDCCEFLHWDISFSQLVIKLLHIHTVIPDFVIFQYKINSWVCESQIFLWNYKPESKKYQIVGTDAKSNGKSQIQRYNRLP